MGRTKPDRTQHSYECERAIQNKNKASWLMQQKRMTRKEEEYARLRKEGRVFIEKEESSVRKLKKVETPLFYRNINGVRNNFKPNITMCRHNNRKLTPKKEVLRR